jgi:hypothetical protein
MFTLSWEALRLGMRERERRRGEVEEDELLPAAAVAAAAAADNRKASALPRATLTCGVASSGEWTSMRGDASVVGNDLDRPFNANRCLITSLLFSIIYKKLHQIQY